MLGIWVEILWDQDEAGNAEKLVDHKITGAVLAPEWRNKELVLPSGTHPASSRSILLCLPLSSMTFLSDCFWTDFTKTHNSVEGINLICCLVIFLFDGSLSNKVIGFP